jgi:hypothetical protein
MKKITNTNQQIIKQADTADKLAGKKKKPDKKVAADQSAAIKTDTVQLSQKSIDLARAAKSGSGSKADEKTQTKADGKTQTNTVHNINENVLAKLLKMADESSVIVGSSDKSSKTDGQEDAAKESDKKIDELL